MLIFQTMVPIALKVLRIIIMNCVTFTMIVYNDLENKKRV